MKYLLCILLMLPQMSFANCVEEVQLIEKGQAANCTGFLFSPDAQEKAVEAVEDVEYLSKVNEKLIRRQDLSDKHMNILDTRLNLYLKQSQVLATELHRKEKEDKFQKFIYFGLGVFATGIAVYGAAHLR